jgi:hypothetical protein
MSGGAIVREVPKGKTGKMIIDTWRTPQGRTLVSVTQLFLDSDGGKYVRKKGGFALSPDEARELARALEFMAGVVEGTLNA